MYISTVIALSVLAFTYRMKGKEIIVISLLWIPSLLGVLVTWSYQKYLLIRCRHHISY